MSYFTLQEAAAYVRQRTGLQIEPSALLRAGVHGVLTICAPFSFGPMYNATLTKNVNFKADFLVIPPAHLLEIETEGRAMIETAFGLDKTLYFPRRVRTLQQLRVLASDLENVIPKLVTVEPHSQEGETPEAANAPVSPANHSVEVLINSASAPKETAATSENGLPTPLTPADRRKKLDISRQRGTRRRIIEKWTNIELEYGPKADAHQVLRVLKRDPGEEAPQLKTVQNLLIALRKESLIP